MIQRIQSVFLLLCAGVLGLNFLFPFASSNTTTQKYYEDGVFNVLDSSLILGLNSASILLILIILFLYKNRAAQIKSSILGFALIGALMGSLLYEITQMTDYAFQLGCVTPLVAVLLLILAFVNIRKDDKLVKSMDRLR